MLTMGFEMKLLRKRVALLGALAAAAAVAGCNDEVPPPVVEPVAPPAADAVGHERVAQRTLEIPGAGNPIVWVRRGERVDLHDSPGGKVIETVGRETEFGSITVFAVHQVRDGWAAVPTPYFENGRLAWVRLDPASLAAGSVPWRVEVDLSEYKATLFLRGRVVRSFRVSIGMPGAATPTGRFAVTDTFRGGLNPAYGCCAVALTARQTRLPSGWMGGDRIAIHGTDGPLGAAVSHGCVRAADRDVNELVNKVPPGTPVLIRN